mmetsp:Transcript_28039/g.50625  ORF Transcript_28039/g.50625 Transcript_28039/m.50625 type:complete len:520 (+) Transcript_28039:64-1623(+)
MPGDAWQEQRSSGEEPLSLRRLRESLSNLEQLERQRTELRDRFESYPGGLTSSGIDDKRPLPPERDRNVNSEGYSHVSKIAGSPSRQRSSSPHATNLGLGNRGSAGTGGASLSSPRDLPWTTQRVTSDQDLPLRSSLRSASPAATRPNKPVARDSALALALERSQDHIDALQRERDDALRKAADFESEVLRLTLLVERSEAGHVAMLDERQKELADVQRLRREHREALEQLASLRAEANQTRSNSDETRNRLERLLAQQRARLEALEEANAGAERELQDRSTRSSDIETALYSCLQERTVLLQFMVDLLTALQTLFYDPTPFVQLNIAQRQAIGERPAPKELARTRSQSRSRVHRHAGCYVCGEQQTSPAAIDRIAQEMTGGGGGSGMDDLRDLCSSLEVEIAQASKAFSAQVQRVLAEAEQSARAVNAASQQDAEQQQLRACAAWVEQERRRREKQGLPADRAMPSVDWAEERSQYQATTRSMETKFAQLAKLRRLLQARYNVAKKRAYDQAKRHGAA